MRLLDYARKGYIARNRDFVQAFLADDPVNNYILLVHDRYYDMSTYASANNQEKFFGENFDKIVRSLGQTTKDATSFFDRIRAAEGVDKWKAIRHCLDNMFFIGVVDHRTDPNCLFSNYMMLASSIALVVVIGFKFIAAFQFMGKSSSPEILDKFVICCVPCYSENSASLRATIDSLASGTYTDKNKLLFIICDGMITGSGNSATTPELVLQILGIENDFSDKESNIFAFNSIGEGKNKYNRAKLFSGVYYNEGRQVPYVVVIKMGNPYESSRCGNRGKRDSQMILMQFLSRVHHRDYLNPLEMQMLLHMHQRIGIDPRVYEFVLWVDADTDVYPSGVNGLVSSMASDTKVVGICGETVLRNEGSSWITMIQVYEYFISHHLAKAFESFFGSVTCLPGCFCMYRIYSTTTQEPMLVSPAVIRDYGVCNVNTLHLKNLLQLGEDRYLTTLMLKHFPDHKTRFTGEAKAKTNAPDRWGVLISQRRRWINSTIHNLWELLSLKDLCGCCCFSMRAVVFLDLFATVVSPAGFIYVLFLIFSLIFDDNGSIPMISLVMLAAIYGLQILIFLVKREWQNIAWMIIYIFAMPLYAFFIPIYAFWHFDDFSWGNTRVIVNETGNQILLESEDDAFDPTDIPLTPIPEYLVHPTVRSSRKGSDTTSRDATPISMPLSSANQQYPSTSRLVTQQELQNSIHDIVLKSDLRQITKRDVIRQLESEFGVQLQQYEAFITECIDSELDDVAIEC